MWAYRETLCDLSAVELDRGCKEAMRQTKFTPTPAEIREYGKVDEEYYGPPRLPGPPSMTKEECAEFLATAREHLGEILKPQKTPGVLEITDEMRERHAAKVREAQEKFGKSA